MAGQFAAFPLWLSAAVMFWVAGFDTIYACQDAEYDQEVGLHSVASRLHRTLLDEVKQHSFCKFPGHPHSVSMLR